MIVTNSLKCVFDIQGSYYNKVQIVDHNIESSFIWQNVLSGSYVKSQLARANGKNETTCLKFEEA